MSPDPYEASAKLTNPGSWNRYAYALEDPINLNDPSGLVAPDCDDLLSQINEFVFGDPDTGFKGIIARFYEQVTFPNPAQFTEMYAYTQAGQTSGKRLQVNETFYYTVNGNQNQTSQTLNLDAAYTYDPEGKTKSVSYPTTYSWNGSNKVAATGPTYTYSFDAMDRPTGLKDQSNNTAVNSVSYNPANQLLGITYFGSVESRGYNSLNQMTTLAVGSDTITYTFPASSNNNGKISQQLDSVSGETVTYQYDSLNRLLSASGSGWSDTYGYDGFGNLLSKTGTGTAPVLSQSVNASNNQVMGQSYDANGNQTTGPLGVVTYDAENRIVGGPGGVQYAYDSRNKRVWRGVVSGGTMTQTVYFYGVDGQLLGTYPISLLIANNVPEMVDSGPTLAVFFGGKRVGMISSTGVQSPFVQDRLGSAGKYYPYGEARGTVPQDAVGFATYTNDSATGLEYADQRYYASNFGRFMSADPYRASNRGPHPQSWNRYTYVQGDPVNFNDRRGLDLVLEDEGNDDSGDGDGGDQEDFGGGGGGGCGAGWETDASLSGPCCPSGDSFAPGDPSPSPFCPAPPPPAPPPPKTPRGVWSLVVTKDCYDVPTNGGPVTREVDYQLVFWALGYAAPMFSNQGVIWEHLASNNIPPAGPDSPSSGAPGTFDDSLSVLLGPRVQQITQTFSAVMSNGSDVGLFVAQFGSFPAQNIVMHSGYVSINGNVGGKVDKNGRLIPGTYTPCP